MSHPGTPASRLPRRRPAAESKAAILTAAREQFAAYGYERATIRGIAAAAAVDPALVMRHFGSKDRLLAEAAHFELRLPDLRAVRRDQVGRVLAENFLDVWETDDRFLALLRAAVSNEAAAERMREVLATQVIPTLVAVTGSRARARQAAGMFATVRLGFALTRYILKLPPVAGWSRDVAVASLGALLDHILDGVRP